MIAALAVLIALAILATRTRISVIIRKDSTDMATIHEQLADLEARVAAIQAPTPIDLTPITDAIAALTSKVDALAADVGTPA